MDNRQQTTDNRPFSCAIIGEGTLPLQCAEIVLSHGHAICAVVSPDVRLARWAAEHGIPYAVAPGELGALLAEQPFDYLFSIVNYQVLPGETLAAPRRWAINYHDAPLPRYAGSYATSWALMAGERTHAVTWHLMTEQLDAGDILVQYPIEIAADESALTLNAKCYDAALRSFAALVADLATGRARPQPQDLAERTFFARNKRPPAGCVLAWSQGAGALAALVRALHFGPYPNPLGLPKLALDGAFAVVVALDQLDACSKLPPGTIVAIEADALVVATATADVALRGLLTIDGAPLTIAELVACFGLRVGQRLPDLDTAATARLTELYGQWCRHEPFWVDQLTRCQPIGLPYATRAAGGPAQRKEYLLRLPADINSSLGEQIGGSRADIVLAAFALYLARLNGSSSFDIGCSDDSLRREAGEMAGFFAAIVPLRIDLDMRWDFVRAARALGEQLARVGRRRSYARDIVARYPALSEPQRWSVVVEVLPPHPPPSPPPALRLSPTSGEGEPEGPKLRLPLSPAWERGSGGEGTLLLQISPDGLECRLIYDASALQPQQIEQMAQQFVTLLRGIVAQPSRPIGTLPLLPDAERRRLLFDWNDTASTFAHDRCIHELFAAQAARTPDAIALAFGSPALYGGPSVAAPVVALTYCELEQRANQLAHYLQKQGVGVETLVGIYMERSPDLIVGLLAILKAGAAYLPIDPSYPPERIAIMLEDSRAAVLLTEQRLSGRLVGADARVVCLDERLREALAHEPATPPASAVASRNLAYVLFTSGSTGRPKGVAIEHRSVAALIGWAEQIYTSEDLAGVLFSTSICFDLSIFELFVPLSRGGTAILVENALALPGLRTPCPVTLINTVPSVIAELVRAGGIPASVRTINLAGEPLSATLVQQLYAQTRAERVFDLYGPSEDTTYSTCALRRPDGPATIGRPIANTQIYLLDANLQPVPIGLPGEIAIGGAGLARGYLNRPELTADRFIPNPFVTTDDRPPTTDAQDDAPGSRLWMATDDRQWMADDRDGLAGGRSSVVGGRLYRTGDLARYLPGGALEFLGRIDHQVKVRGFRIELGEIETALRQHAAVREAVVVARDDVGSSKRLVAYIVTTDDRRPTADDGSFQSSILGSRTLDDFLRQRLPEYMLPAAFVFLDALPLTPNGKVDRRALPAPDRADAGAGQGYVAPRDHVEEVLAGIWSQVLGVPQVGIHDNFFALGGDSIISIQIVARASQLGLRLASRQIFQHQTIAELASQAGLAPIVHAEQGPLAGAMPLTPIQRWFFEHELPERQHWNQAMLLELREDVGATPIERAFERLIIQHDALRLRFERGADGWRQHYAAPGGPAPFRIVDLAALPPAEQSARMSESMAAAQASLDIANGPLLRAILFDLGAAQPARLLVVVHHLAVDGVSWRILFDDLQALVLAGPVAHASPLPPKTSSFQSWSIGLERYVRSGRLQPELDAWMGLARAQAPRLPLDFPAQPGANSEATARRLSAALSAEETHALLHEVPAAYHAQINDVMMTALALAFASWTGVRTLLVDLEGHGREDLWEDLDLSRTVGWFTAIFPVLLELDPGTSTVAALGAIKEQLSYVPRRGVGYGLLRYLGDQELAAKLRALPQAEVSFNYLGQFDNIFAEGAPFRLLHEPVGPLHGPRGQRFHLIEITGQVAGGRLHMEWAYSPHLHRRATIEALAEGFMAALRALIAARHAPQTAGYIPGDVPLAQLEQTTLDRLDGDGRDIEAIYPLAPGQQAMLAHTLRDPAPGVYSLQWRCTLHGAIDVAAFQRAWQRAIERHAALRTSFVWEKQAQPLQIVHRHATALWQQHDLRKLAPAEQQIRLDALLASDQARTYDLSRPPLLRLMLVRLADDRALFCWSYHHLLLDGWSVAPLLQDVLSFYDEARGAADGAGRRAGPQAAELQLAPVRPFRDYLAWLDRQDHTAATSFWRSYLGGATPFRLSEPARQDHGYAEQQRRMSLAATSALRALAQRGQITLNTLVQGAKALLLSRHSGRDDVIFGVTVAGRPADLDGVETIVGPFINTLPLRVVVPPEARLLPWLRGLQAQQAELAQFDYTPLAQAQESAGLDAGAPLFETILRFQNYPLDSSLWQRAGLAIRDIAWFDRWHYPICFVVEPGAELTLGATYDRRRFGHEQIAQLLEQMQRILELFIDEPNIILANVLELIEAKVR